jgi:hypothetical protein
MVHELFRLGTVLPFCADIGQEPHFRSSHYPCLYPSCLESKFVVFSTDLDLKAHQLEVHGSRGKVDLGFQYRSSGRVSPRRDQRLQREEQREVQAEDGRLRPPPGFGTHLSEPTPTVATPTVPAIPTVQVDPNSISGKILSLFNGNQEAYHKFKAHADQFKISQKTASSLLKLMLEYSRKEEEVGRIWKKMADTAPDAYKTVEMMRAWNDHRAQAKAKDTGDLVQKVDKMWPKGGKRVMVIKNTPTTSKNVIKSNALESAVQDAIRKSQEKKEAKEVSRDTVNEVVRETPRREDEEFVERPPPRKEFPGLPTPAQPVQTWIPSTPPPPGEEDKGKKKKKQILFRFG